MTKDWKGNKKSIFTTLGASSHSLEERQTHDYYATEPKALEKLLELEEFAKVWECACGQGHLSEVLKKYEIHAKSTDIIDRGYGDGVFDFLSIENQGWDGDIITNPPYKYAQDFVEKSLQIIPNGRKVGMFLRIQFLEGKARRQLFKVQPPKVVYVSSSRLGCAKNGDFEKYNESGSASCYCWFVWEKGYKGTTELKWFN